VALQLAIIGCGTKATQYIQTWISRDDLSIRAVMDPNPAAMTNVATIAAAAGKTAPVSYSDWQQLLNTEAGALDAVYICTPHVAHAEQALLALNLGLDVLLEKPMVTTVAEAQALAQAQQRSGKTLVVAYQGGLSPLVAELRDAIASEKYGPLVSINAAIWEDWADKYQGHWKQIPAISGGGFMFDTGAHMMNTVSRITSKPFARISAIMQNLGFPVDVVTTVSGELSDGTLFNLHASGRAIRCVSRIECFFPTAIVRICAWGRWMEIEDAKGNVVRKEQEAANNLMNVFMQTRLGEIDNPSDVQQGLRMAQLWDAIKLSASQHGVPVTL
jgi:predicted dehydrogenase